MTIDPSADQLLKTMPSQSPKPKLAVLISGSGSNLQALLDAMADGALAAEPTVVVSNKKEAYGLMRAETAGVPTVYFPYRPFKESGREAYDTALADQVASYEPNLIVLAGWMRILTPAFLDRFPMQVINLHPALPGQFAGTHAIERAYEAFQQGEISHSGCMVHYAIPEVDAGPVIGHLEVPIHPADTLDDFATRMHQAEHKLIVQATAEALNQLKDPKNR